MRKTFARKYSSPTKRKVTLFLAISEGNKTAQFILFNECCTFGIKHFMLAIDIILLKGMLVPTLSKSFQRNHLKVLPE